MSQAIAKRIISMSLYGDKSRYIKPAIRSAANFQRFYPGWHLVFFVDDSVANSVIAMLDTENSSVIRVDKSADPNGMFWRFKAVSLPLVSTVIFRDADSELSQREALAVSEWLSSGRLVHVMRDHPFHNYPILGGMFGVLNTPDIQASLEGVASKSDEYGEDISALVDNFYRHIDEGDVYTHDEFFNYSQESFRFPYSAVFGSYVGEVAEDPIHRKFALRFIRAIGLLRVKLFGRLHGIVAAK